MDAGLWFPVRGFSGVPRVLQREATAVARVLGRAKTYDAEYVAVARLINAPLVTIDARFARRAGGLVRILGPTEL